MELILVFRSISVVLFFLSRNMMNQSLSTYKTLKWNSPMQASQWWVWPSPSAVLCLNLTVYSQFGLFSEFHIRVPLWTQRFLHKHSPDKDLQNEVWARRVGSLLFRRAGDHGLHGVRLNPWLSLFALTTLVTSETDSVFRCTVDWVKGKNVTLKTIKKKQKHKGRGTVRTVTKTVPNDSFFNFFSPPEGKTTSSLILHVSVCLLVSIILAE